MDTNIWFPELHDTGRNPAKTICHDCPVQTECLNYAIDQSINFGIWGGKSPRQRARIRRDRNALNMEMP